MDANEGYIYVISQERNFCWIKTTKVVGSTLVGCKGHGTGMWLQTRQGASPDSSVETVCVFWSLLDKKIDSVCGV